MREILFRGKRLDTGEWVEGNLWLYGKKARIAVDLGFTQGLSWIEVDPATVGQFTGYFYKEGKRVFEGDVIKYYDLIANEELTSFVEWWEDGFVLQEIRGFNAPSMCLVFEESRVEIIGNIHDNPELLKGGDADGKERAE